MRILLVDDYPDALEMWDLYLRMAGYEVFTAETGPRALELAEQVRPDVIVMDLELPGMTGLEAARHLRSRAVTAAIPLIAATGYSHAAQLDAAEHVGFEAILVKPCDPVVLRSEIERVTTRRRTPGDKNPGSSNENRPA
jgi:CheY-like chemotaxis protein